MIEILERTRDRIKHPANWCKKYFARDITGQPTDPLGTEAISWCLQGALNCECKDSKEYMSAFHYLQDLVGVYVGWTNSLGNFNNNSKHEDVIEFLGIAITARKFDGDPIECIRRLKEGAKKGEGRV